MSKICHAHCPDEGGLLAAVLVVVLTAVLAVIAAEVIESLFMVIVVTGGVLITAGTGLFVWLVRRDRQPAAIPARPAPARSLSPARRSAALSTPRIRAIDAVPISPARPAEEGVRATARARTGPQ